jgi:hypothetical protein
VAPAAGFAGVASGAGSGQKWACSAAEAGFAVGACSAEEDESKEACHHRATAWS